MYNSSDLSNLQEVEYIYTSEHHLDTVSSKDSIIAYPIVTLREIETNNSLVINTTLAATTKIRQSAYSKCAATFDRFRSELSLVIKEYNEFASCQKSIANDLSVVLTELTKRQESYMTRPPSNSEDLDHQKIAHHNLCVKDGLSTLFLTTCSRYIDLTKRMHDISEEAREINVILRERLSSIKELEVPPTL